MTVHDSRYIYVWVNSMIYTRGRARERSRSTLAFAHSTVPDS